MAMKKRGSKVMLDCASNEQLCKSRIRYADGFVYCRDVSRSLREYDECKGMEKGVDRGNCRVIGLVDPLFKQIQATLKMSVQDPNTLPSRAASLYWYLAAYRGEYLLPWERKQVLRDLMSFAAWLSTNEEPKSDYKKKGCRDIESLSWKILFLKSRVVGELPLPEGIADDFAYLETWRNKTDYGQERPLRVLAALRIHTYLQKNFPDYDLKNPFDLVLPNPLTPSRAILALKSAASDIGKSIIFFESRSGGYANETIYYETYFSLIDSSTKDFQSAAFKALFEPHGVQITKLA